MSETPSTWNERWQEVTNELLSQSQDPDSGISITRQQSAYLRLVKPVAFVEGIAVLSVPHARAKKEIETTLGPVITEVLSRRLGRQYSLAVSVHASEEEPEDSSISSDSASAYQERSAVSGHYGVGSANAAFQNQQNAAYRQSQDAQHPVTFGSSSYGNEKYPENTPEQGFSTPRYGFNEQNFNEVQHTSSGTSHTAPQSGSALLHDPLQTRSAEAPLNQDYPGNTGGWRTDHIQESTQAEQIPSGTPRTREQPSFNPDRALALNPHYTFDSYVVSDSNKLPCSAAIAVAEKPARAYNPLFIWGDSGLGKTHLMHAVGNYAQYLNPRLRIKYVSSEEFTNEYINSVRDDRQEAFKRKYRELDILMVDDIQFLQGKEGTQEEFFHTFNALYQANKQIVLSSDRPPKQLTTLEDRLRTRFQAGLIADIYPPDLETRIAILMKKAASERIVADREAIELIASRFNTSIRELEGAFIRVSAYASLMSPDKGKHRIDLRIAEKALEDMMPEQANQEITATTILAATAEYFEMDVNALKGSGKTRAVAHARQLAMYLCRELTDLSLPKIGEQFGGKDHTTVMYADRKIRKEITEKKETYDEIQLLTQQIKSSSRG
ncbi:chromosomal replication initiator protein DnaA [Corynebacterium ulcerans]|uniref:chromosomal replication initiator protein DnaA n=1 Tax=Corynebacterium ulcerans TaxID=65058 RepID=UPI00051F842D|nr:chromosomal replication initiator protein DnaA [Corynebacterium ulcerans]AIT87985.1 Chromosomal replication initiator protein DnaA [Corynebacterium ulcerans]ALD93745.1 Chromosomal replication initiator protein DnaA [Corynebacterium ulcerans]KPH78919.1 chromosomal replication initiation protein [Corynebacterium ulcerans]MBH5297667.1 chromosomal replication initiator protein DnaA [Corynebacterium ulcerans]OIS06213.1 chromosomal replication initiation protein [Corynebacterium ulcerans]